MPALAEGGPTEVYKCCCYYLLSLMIVVAVVLFPLGCLELSNTTTLCTVLQKTPSEWQWIESDPRNDIDIECIDHITRSDKYLYPGASTTQLNSTQPTTHSSRPIPIHPLPQPAHLLAPIQFLKLLHPPQLKQKSRRHDVRNTRKNLRVQVAPAAHLRPTEIQSYRL